MSESGKIRSGAIPLERVRNLGEASLPSGTGYHAVIRCGDHGLNYTSLNSISLAPKNSLV